MLKLKPFQGLLALAVVAAITSGCGSGSSPTAPQQEAPFPPEETLLLVVGNEATDVVVVLERPASGTQFPISQTATLRVRVKASRACQVGAYFEGETVAFSSLVPAGTSYTHIFAGANRPGVKQDLTIVLFDGVFPRDPDVLYYKGILKGVNYRYG